MSRIVRLAGGALGGLKGDLKPNASINNDLMFCLGAHPAGSPLLGVDLVSRVGGTLGGGAAFNANHPDETWKSLDLATVDDYIKFAIQSAFDTALDGASVYTIAVYAEVFAASESFAVFLAIPYNDSSHSSPFHTVALTRQSTSAEVVTHFWYDGTALRNFNNDDGGAQGDMWRPDGSAHWLVATRNGQNNALYLDGVEQHADPSATGGNVTFNASGSSKIVIGTRNDSDLGESLVAEIHSLSFWDRELSTTEISDLNTTPTLQFIT